MMTTDAVPTPPAPTLETTGVAEPGHLGADGLFLRPGDWACGSGQVRVATLLGSGVALALWSPRLRLGAVCHWVQPTRPGGALQSDRLDGRFAEDAGQWLMRRLAAAGCRWPELRAALAGGAQAGDDALGAANIAWAQQWAAGHGLPLVQQDVGGRVMRRLGFNLADGQLTVAHGGHLRTESP